MNVMENIELGPFCRIRKNRVPVIEKRIHCRLTARPLVQQDELKCEAEVKANRKSMNDGRKEYEVLRSV